ncbi:Integrin alpha-V [Heterocephalus glaber]|uniref:Integrin alpha-V n=1 Tax=Heterocephalus glaber TaxID=10181 RepID=G5B530_HETGA|nr:Integrin alpha-V [Heterocephalus glaber]
MTGAWGPAGRVGHGCDRKGPSPSPAAAFSLLPVVMRMFLLVGAPKANTTQPGIVEGGQVLKCDWSSSRHCQPIEFDSTAKLKPDPPTSEQLPNQENIPALGVLENPAEEFFTVK